MTIFEIEAINFDSKYEWNQIAKKIKILRRVKGEGGKDNRFTSCGSMENG
jgi:hypothetical protein